MQKTLDALYLQHNVIANNIANAATPNFKRSEVSFDHQLKMALGESKPSLLWRTNPLDLPMPATTSLNNFHPTVRTVWQTVGRNDGNNVDMDSQMTELSENTLRYEALAQLSNDYISLLTNSITGQ